MNYELRHIVKKPLPENELQALGKRLIFEVGSRTIPDGYSDKSDWDFLVFSPKPIARIISGIGYDLEVGGAHYDPAEGIFNSWRKGDVNIILTCDINFKEKFLHASKMAFELGLKDRDSRVKLFRKELYGEEPVSEWGTL